MDAGDLEFDEKLEGYGFETYDQQGDSLLGADAPADTFAPAPSSSAPSPSAPPSSATMSSTTASSAAMAPQEQATTQHSETTAAPLALYRRYRPDTFAEVIGQQHVTDPVQRALTNNRVNHAYLFSGPRGCGKTTSARILARCLNCAQGPTPTPCGTCRSCRDLARGGPGSIDVIEIDAASHGGVDDARDLRERAFFAPVHSRYKIYIVDEAHMVTTAGFNALLKLVEEPPPHVKFVFATTEPEKVIGTIRSRTHHYPFRLVPPRTLQAYLASLCEAEGIAVEPTVLPLVVRAGAGSVRDSLSVLDQLLGGAAESGVSYAQAAALLGYTPDSLLDEIVDAFAAGDAAGVFACIDKVVEVGQDPHRFGEDLLRRLRDLVIVAAVPDAIGSGLVEVADDQAERLISQAAALGQGELTRAAEVLATGLTEMRGTTAPRLHLELMCARVLLPGADVDERGFHARLDRLERRLAGLPVAPASTGIPAAESRVESADRSMSPMQTGEPGTRSSQRLEGPPSSVPSYPERTSPSPTGPVDSPPLPPRGTQGAVRAVPPPPAGSTPVAHAASDDSAPAAAPQGSGLKVADVRRMWPDVLEEVKSRRRFTWILLSQNAQVTDVHDGVLTLALKNAGARDSFGKGGNEDVLRDAIVEVLRVDLTIQTMVDGAPPAAPPARPQPVSPPPAATSPPAAEPSHVPVTRDVPSDPGPRSASETSPHPASPSSPAAPVSEPPEDHPVEPSPVSEPPSQQIPATRLPAGPQPSTPPARSQSGSDDRPGPPPQGHPASAPRSPREDASGAALARGRIQPTRRHQPDGPPPEDEPPYDPYDDIVEGEAELDSHDLLARHLGAELISEEDSRGA